MSSFTAADLKLGGRLMAACDAVGAGHLNKAAGIFAEIADDLNQEATANGLLADEDDWSAPMPSIPVPPPVTREPQDLQMCARNVHSYSAPDPVSGWRTCNVCGSVNVAPPAS